ncbi:peptidylprolyl isomerase [Kordia algicida OT-1]|uniref:peptidylprolyl isomerase n=1 Tax=Kordia algicida OT-1 TaxID=391587 RepID=A9ECN7_9FLAO|nr:peptidylprolyl isomerase [Kordia algicida]EDP94394.1 peptidyl-prolyl cis-trans isomerase [Kordia algicida OT-1]
MKLFTTTITLFLAIITLGFTSCKSANNQDLEDGLYAEIKTTKGTMLAKLFYKQVPVTVANFVGLAEGTHPKLADSLQGKPYYNDIIFHRVMDKFMIQTGDQTGTGRGNPGFRFMSELDPNLKHDKPGMLSMANSGGLNTNGSQFFITEVPYPSLDAFDASGNLKPCDQPRVSCHAVFGELVKGLEVQDSISNVAVSKDRATLNKPLEDIKITEINIIRKGSDAKAFDAAKVFNEKEAGLPARHEKLKEEQLEKQKERAKKAAESFKEANKDLGEFYESPTGIVMVTTEKGSGVQPNSADKVMVNCAGYLDNGKLFYTTYKELAQKEGIYNEVADERGFYAPFPSVYNQSATLVPGFKEALLRMKVGEKAKVFIPSHLGYGSRPNGPIPANSNLIFDIEIVKIADK